MKIEHDIAYSIIESVGADHEYNKPAYSVFHGSYNTIEEATRRLGEVLPDDFYDYVDTRFFFTEEEIEWMKSFIDFSEYTFTVLEDRFDDDCISNGKHPKLTLEQRLKFFSRDRFKCFNNNEVGYTFHIVKNILVPTEVIK
jgi:hypothetical protein